MKINSLPKWARSTRAWLVFAAAVFAFYAGAATIGLDIPRPAFHSEHERDINVVTKTHREDVEVLTAGGQALAAEIQKNKVSILEGTQRSLRRQLIDIRTAKRQLKQKGDFDPQLERDEQTLQNQLRDIGAKLQRVRGH